MIAGISGLVASTKEPLDAPAQSSALAHVGLASIFTLAFGILAVAGEYRHRTIIDTYLSTPARGRVVAAKLVVYAFFGAVTGVVASGVGVGVAAAWWSDKGVGFAWGDSAMWATIGGGIAWNAAFAAIGGGLGALIRNLGGAIATALAWVALVEGIVGQLVGDFARWLPFDAGQALGAGSKAMLNGSLLPRWGGGAVLAGYTVLFATLEPSACCCAATCPEVVRRRGVLAGALLTWWPPATDQHSYSRDAASRVRGPQGSRASGREAAPAAVPVGPWPCVRREAAGPRAS